MTAMSAHTVKLVRLREGIYATGTRVGDRCQPPRVVHAVDTVSDLDAPDGVVACCGSHFASGTLVAVSGRELVPHKHCLRRLLAAGLLVEGGAVDG
jgi:hypothetical protein